jgi:hypothetical protein
VPSHALTSDQSKKIVNGHGKVGYVGLNVSVTPEQKDALTEEVRLAIAKHLENSL